MALDESGATRGRSVCHPPPKYIAMSPRLAGAAGRAHAPERVADAVLRREIEQRCRFGFRSDDPIDLARRTVGEEHRTGLRAEREHVFRPIVFLVAPRTLVLLDHVTVVLVE